MAGYVEKTLASDEEIVYRANFNWTYNLVPTLWFLIGVAPAALFAYQQFVLGTDPAALRLGWQLAAGAAAVGSMILLAHMVVLWTTEIVVTTYRFVFKQGLIARTTQEVSLNKIEEINLDQSIWGRLLGYGQLVMRGTGVGVIELPAIDNPIRVRQIIEDARSRLRRGNISAADDD
ncbi:MAG: PH domain-containing protein [Pseudomonadota bacterium]